MPTRSGNRKREESIARVEREKRGLSSLSGGDQLALVPKLGLGGTFGLSEGVREYAEALHSPWTLGLTPRMPVMPMLPTQIGHAVLRFTVGAKAGSWGVAIVSPDTAVANDSRCLLYTDSATITGATLLPTLSQFVGTAAPTGWKFGVATQGPRSTADYLMPSSGAVASAYSVRTVAAGLRVAYMGTELERGGEIVTIVEPSLGSLLDSSVSTTSVDGLLQDYNQIRRYDVSMEDWVGVTRPHLYAAQAAYLNTATPAPSGQPPIKFRYTEFEGSVPKFQNPNMLLAVYNPSGNDVAYKAEFHIYYEYFGRRFVSGARTAVPDEVGHSTVAAHHYHQRHLPDGGMMTTGRLSGSSHLRAGVGSSSAIVHRNRDFSTTLKDFGRWAGRNLSHFRPVLKQLSGFLPAPIVAAGKLGSAALQAVRGR